MIRIYLLIIDLEKLMIFFFNLTFEVTNQSTLIATTDHVREMVNSTALIIIEN